MRCSDYSEAAKFAEEMNAMNREYNTVFRAFFSVSKIIEGEVLKLSNTCLGVLC